MNPRVAGLFALCGLIASCAGSSPLRRVYAFEPSPPLEGPFRSGSAWRGGDGAYSVDLGSGRVLWLFGDSFVGEGPDETRAERTMVRNSLALSTGYDVDRLELEFYHGTVEGEPTAFFGAEETDGWLWPGPGVRLNDGLLLTFMRVAQHDDALGFRTEGSLGLWVTNPDEPPDRWEWRSVDLPVAPPGVRWGTGALLEQSGFLYAFPAVEPGSHDVYLARWQVADLASGNVPEPRWWNGRTWDVADNARPVVTGVQTEFSVHRSKYGELWMVSVDGFGGTNVVARTAIRPSGPWNSPEVLFRPEESDRDGVLVYSAKAHPHIGKGDPLATNIPGIYAKEIELVITYCTNHQDFWTMASDMGLYFPRLVRVRRR